MNFFNSFKRLTLFETLLWIVSVLAILLSGLTGAFDLLSLSASIIGVTALIFVAKGDVLGQLLTIVFSILYAVASFKLRYYGEMITYLAMTAPMAALSAVSWLKNPYKRGENEVRIVRISKRKIAVMIVLTVIVTTAFYFILKAFSNARLAVSTVSITTSFMASYLTYSRSYLYALAYAANDVVLIVLWSLAAASQPYYISMVICFIMFFANDIYGFINWRRLYKQQNKNPV